MNNKTVQKVSRRGFLETSGLALTAARLGEFSLAAQGQGQLYAYVGKTTPGFLGGPMGGGIDVLRVNMTDGSMQTVSSTGSEVQDLNSDGICASADGRFLYCVNRTTALEGMPGAGGGVAAFAINRMDGSLRHLNTRPSMGAMPISVKIDKTNARVIVGNHGAVSRLVHVVKKNGVAVVERPTDEGTIAMFPVGPDGSLGSPLDVFIYPDTPAPGTKGIRPEALGPNAGAQIGPGCHAVAFDQTGRWLLASDVGYDHIYVFPFSPSGRMLAGKAFPVAPGSAPRHIAVHPRAPYFFITNEREPSVSAFHLDSNTGEVRHVQTVPALPESMLTAPGPAGAPAGFRRSGTMDIRVHPNGKFVYSSNSAAGKNSITTFAINESAGRLNRVDVVEMEGNFLREMNIEPSGKFVFICNTGGNEVTSFALDPGTGKMTRKAKASVERASVIDFAML